MDEHGLPEVRPPAGRSRNPGMEGRGYCAWITCKNGELTVHGWQEGLGPATHLHPQTSHLAQVSPSGSRSGKTGRSLNIPQGTHRERRPGCSLKVGVITSSHWAGAVKC